MDNFNQAISNIADTVNKIDTDFTATRESQAEYQAELDSCIFETRDILHQMQEESIKESKYNHRVNLIIITIALLTLITTVISLFR